MKEGNQLESYKKKKKTKKMYIQREEGKQLESYIKKKN